MSAQDLARLCELYLFEAVSLVVNPVVALSSRLKCPVFCVAENVIRPILTWAG